jgi:TonB family protein
MGFVCPCNDAHACSRNGLSTATLPIAYLAPEPSLRSIRTLPNSTHQPKTRRKQTAFDIACRARRKRQRLRSNGLIGSAASAPNVLRPRPGGPYNEKDMIRGVAVLALASLLSAAPARLKKHVEPGYSEEARKAHVSGVVVLSVTIGADGRVRNVKVLKSLGHGLDDNAVQAIRAWEFDPATDEQGNGVESTIPIECHFSFVR